MSAAIYFVLALLTWAVFGQTIGHDFVAYDDQNYVYENPAITGGITTAAIVAAFTQPHADNWHPLTTISHMLDCQFFGLDPAGHHLINVLLQAAAALLLFSVLNAMTGAVWRSALAAAVFAIHPLRVESVAWVSERKDVLSGVLFMLTLGAYVRYVRDRRLARYLALAACFALAVMAKPTVIVLPVLLLLLDYWPLGRFADEQISRRDNQSVPTPAAVFALCRSQVFVEKIPLFLLSSISGIITLFVQRQSVDYGGSLPITGRLSNAAVSCVAYIRQLVWPTKLAVFYPNAADRASAMTALAAALLLVAVTAIVVRLRRKRPYLMVGWCWYIVALLPVAGIVQVGLQGRADRYTYLSQIGLCIAGVWGLTELLAKVRVPGRQVVATVLGMCVIGVFAWRASIQATVWRDTESLWRHALAVTEQNDVAHYNVAGLLMKRGCVDEAVQHYQAALNAGACDENHGHLSPGIVENSLGNALARKGQIAAAMMHYRKSLELRPDLADARTNLAAMLLREGDVAGAILEYEKVVATPPEDAVSHERMADMLLKADRVAEAANQYRRALELAPNSLNAINALGWLLATASDPAINNGSEALALSWRANALTSGKDPVVLRILAASYASCAQWANAVATAENARTLLHDNPALAGSLEREIALYKLYAAEASRRTSR